MINIGEDKLDRLLESVFKGVEIGAGLFSRGLVLTLIAFTMNFNQDSLYLGKSIPYDVIEGRVRERMETLMYLQDSFSKGSRIIVKDDGLYVTNLYQYEDSTLNGTCEELSYSMLLFIEDILQKEVRGSESAVYITSGKDDSFFSKESANHIFLIYAPVKLPDGVDMEEALEHLSDTNAVIIDPSYKTVHKISETNYRFTAIFRSRDKFPKIEKTHLPEGSMRPIGITKDKSLISFYCCREDGFPGFIVQKDGSFSKFSLLDTDIDKIIKNDLDILKEVLAIREQQAVVFDLITALDSFSRR